MKTHLMHPDYVNKRFDPKNLPEEIEQLSQDCLKSYNRIPSTEIWNMESVNSTISQIEFSRDSGHFMSTDDIRAVYQALYQTIEHMKDQADHGCKFLPGENPQTKKNNFKMFFNRLVLGDNSILVMTDHLKTSFINYGHLNYMLTRDESFCDELYKEFENLMKRSTQISLSSEKQRNVFFGILFAKINDRIKRL
jgi:hypothetical protein